MMRAIILFTRAPSALGKTRLTAGLDAEAAHALRRALLLDTLEVVASAGAPIIVRFTPTAARAEIEALLTFTSGPTSTSGPAPLPVSAIAQRENCDLGERMYASLLDAQSTGVEQIVLVGADLANLPATHLHDAFAQLDRGTDAVLGPAEDGGYYLVGARAHALAAAKPLFDEIAWGSDTVLTQTLAAAAAAGLRTALIAPWFDVDTRADLARVNADPRPDAARHTRAWLAHHSVPE